MRVALVAGRAASRWATSTVAAPSSSSRSHPSSTSITYAPAALLRHLSTTRALLSEAEATAPQPLTTMSEYMQQKRQRDRVPQQSTPRDSSLGIFGPPKTPPKPPKNALQDPWVSRGSNVLSRPGSRSKSGSVIDTMDELGLYNSVMSPRPDSNDFSNQTDMSRMGHGPRPVDVKYRLRPVIGRTVDLNNNIDVARGLAILGQKVSANRVRNELNKQRFHERPGLKRKRQRSERWQKRFKEGFKATCKRVRELARQGW